MKRFDLRRTHGVVGCLSTVLLFFALLAGQSFAQNAAPSKADRAPEIRLSGDVVTMPIVMVREYPFIEGEIEGVHGKLMVDTGAEQALAINDHLVPLQGGLPIGSGHFGSGQTFQIRLNASVSGISFGGKAYGSASKVSSQNAIQLEHITPDFLGWIGYDFWRGYAMKLDYRRLTVTFYREGPERYLQSETVVAVLPFQLRKLPNHPVIPIHLGSSNAVAAFDTGQYGTLFVENATRAALLSAHILKQTEEDGKFDLGAFAMDGHPFSGVPAIEVEPDIFAASAPIGLTERNVLTIGFGFLRQYKTVWDFRKQTIYILRK